MTAFGPYKEKEVIDFSKLDNHHLFVISGATGAGKTTIFDGICFALYGTASGSDRENTAMLRSHFADDDTHTSVELLFELNNRTYRVFRQLPHLKEGNKTKTGERYEFFELLTDGSEVPAVDRQIVSEINEKLEAIIGLTQDQFKQIVMLPQGEFRKLLTSDTENKEAILRRLFKTERYVKMNDILKEKKEDAAMRFQNEETMMEHHIESIRQQLEKREGSALFAVLESEHFNTEQIIDGLRDEINHLAKKVVDDQQHYEHALKQYEEEQDHLHKARHTNERFLELDRKIDEWTQLQNQQDVFAEKELQAEAANRASSIEPYERQLIERRNELAERAAYATEAAKLAEEAKKRLDFANKTYEQEEEKEELREKTKKNLNRLNEYLPAIEEMDAAKQQMKKIKAEGKQTAAESERIKQSLELKEKKAENLKKAIAENEAKVTVRDEKQEEIYRLLEQHKVLDRYFNTWKKHGPLEKAAEEKEKRFMRAEKKHREAEAAWLENQAHVLASRLEDGAACPVCGSAHHPNKAKSDQEGMTKAELDHLKADMETKQKAHQDALADFRSVANQLADQAKEASEYITDLAQVEQEIETIVERGKKLRTEVAELDKMKENIDAAKKTIDKLETNIKQERKQKEAIDEQLTNSRTVYAEAHATYQERMRNIPEEMQDLTALKTKIAQLEKEKVTFEKRWKEAQEELRLAEKEHIAAQANVQHGQKQFDEIKQIVEKAEKEFQKYLHDGKFANEEAYKQAKMPRSIQDALKQEIEQYKQQMATLKKQIEELKEELKEKERIDIKAIEEKLQELKVAYEAAFNRLNQTKHHEETAKNIKENILLVRKQIEAVEKELAAVTDLYDVLRGAKYKKDFF